MPIKPNYRFERHQRSKTKAAKKEAKAAERAARRAAKKLNDEMSEDPEVTVDDDAWAEDA
jgi:hypothetical protein